MSKIIGNTVGTTMLRPNWEETDERSSAYIGNKPTADDGNFLVGNGKGNLKEMTPEEVLSHINGASVTTMTTAEYEALGEDEFNANTLYVLTDGEEVSIEDIPNLYVWKKYDGNPIYYRTHVSNAIIAVAPGGYNCNISYADEIDIVDETIMLVDSKKIEVADYLDSQLNTIKGKYVNYGNIIYFIPDDVKFSHYTNGSLTWGIEVSIAYKIEINDGTKGSLGYVSSKSFSVYPTSGEHTDGYWYEYYRQLGDAAVVDDSSVSFAETDPTVPAWAKATNKPTYTASEVGARPDTWMPTAEDVGALPADTVIPEVPTKVSAFTNDVGYLTEHQSLEDYAKTADLGALAIKDSLTASEVGALPDTTVIPDSLADLADDSAHRTVTDEEKSTWNEKISNSGWSANKYLGTDENGNIVEKDAMNNSQNVDGVVLYTEQDLTNEQKAQARENIGVEETIMDILIQLDIVPVVLNDDGSVLAEDDGAILVNL